jgi:RNA-directed DNA polymerase
MVKTPKSKEGWNAIQWVTVEGYVRKLQQRIYLASKEGNTKLVRNLQNRLVNSYNAKLVATQRVTQDNKGKKTAGVDGVISLKPQQRFNYVTKIKICSKASPLRRVWIPKPGKKEKRPLGIPTMTDRINQALFKLALEPEWEAKFEPNSYGFRPGRGCHDAIKQIYLSINKKPKYVLDADIRKCFDLINHQKLLEKVGFGKGKFHNQIKAWLESGVVNQDVFQETEAGTPQGGVISPLLANIALHGMETMLKDLMKSIPLRTSKGTSIGTRDKQRSLSVIRYADDFVVMHYDKDVVIKCKEAIQIWLKDIGLELSEEKTRITHTLELTEEEKIKFQTSKPGFDFLGFTICQFHAKYTKGQINGVNTIIVPSAKKCKAHQEQLAFTIRRNVNLNQELLIKSLNPIIVGWSRYFGLSDAITQKVLQKMDFLLYLKLRRWAKRKTSSAALGIRKYWKTQPHWSFETNEGMKLTKHSDYARSIKNEYEKVIGEYSPFDKHEIYWASRIGNHPLLSKSQAMLLKKQKGKCNLCGLRFMDEDILEIDHIIPLSMGGNKNISNLQILHRHCHDQKAPYKNPSQSPHDKGNSAE